jgi:hypothetical protein
VNRQGIGLDAALRSGSVGGTERGCSSAVERQLPKLNVVGSIPITRSILVLWVGCANARNTFLLLRVALADVGRF